MSNSKFNSAPISDAFNGFAAARQFPKQEPSKRPQPFSIRFTEKERAILEREAKGQSWASYIRECVFSDTATLRQRGRKDTFTQAVLSRALGELGKSRLASNLNQIARAANIGALPATPKLQADLKAACDDIQIMRDALISALGIKVEW